MLSIEQAQRAILERVRVLPARLSDLDQALGAILAEPIVADLDLPPFDKATVDGYALRTVDVAKARADAPCDLEVTQTITAGQIPTGPLQAGQAASIMTGAPLPPGADAVVMHERIDVLREGRLVRFVTPIDSGQNRLARGREMARGDVILRPGDRLNPARLGLLASVGRTSVSVMPMPRVAIQPTGDELVEPFQAPGPGQIRNSNATVLSALVRDWGGRPDPRPIAPDDPDRLRQALQRSLEADVVLISGGVSAGERDLVPETLVGLGVEPIFHKVRIKPGKPLWFGVGSSRRGGRPGPLVFGLPGNPVSGLVNFLVLIEPALNAMVGRDPSADTRRTWTGRLAGSFTHRGPRPTYYPARWRVDPHSSDATGRVVLLDWAGSADLRTVAQADGFAIFPEGERIYSEGQEIAFLPWIITGSPSPPGFADDGEPDLGGHP